MKQITFRMIDELSARAGESQRLRTNLNVHESLSDPVQRLFIAAGLFSYFRPHRHPGKSEFAMVVRGCFDVLLFDEDGCVSERFSAGPEKDIFGFEIPAGAFHTWIPRAENSVFFEVKQGPYDPDTTAAFAPWSPEEGSPGVKYFQARLLAAGVGDKIA